MTKYYADENGAYIGGFEGIAPPEGAIEVPSAPDNAAHMWIDGVWVDVTPLTETDYTDAIQSMLDGAAQARRYTDGNTMSTYVNSTNEAWAAEAQAFVAWRDAIWAYAYEQLALVMSGQRDQPTVEELVAELPTATWPE